MSSKNVPVVQENPSPQYNNPMHDKSPTEEQLDHFDQATEEELTETPSPLVSIGKKKLNSDIKQRPQSSQPFRTVPKSKRGSTVRSMGVLKSSTNWLRGMVSKKKKRLVEGGYNLDLSYITPRIIAMGFPCFTAEAAYRNPLTEVRGFLDWKHGEHYMAHLFAAMPPLEAKKLLFRQAVRQK